MDNKDFQKTKTSKESQEIFSNIGAKSKDDALTQPLTQRKKIFLVIVFLIGIALSYPTVLPFGVICSAILLFQRNKKANIAAFVLIGYQIMWVLLLALNLG